MYLHVQIIWYLHVISCTNLFSRNIKTVYYSPFMSKNNIKEVTSIHVCAYHAHYLLSTMTDSSQRRVTCIRKYSNRQAVTINKDLYT